MSLTKLTITEAQAKLRKREFSATELIQSHLEAIEASKDLNHYITICHEEAIAQAAKADEDLANNNAKSLTGIPVGIKDLYCTKGILTTAASKMLSNYVPHYESSVTASLFAHGGINIGKTNMDEFAMGSANTYSYYGPAINPWRNPANPEVALVAGGSSGGSAGTVASYTSMASLGSDTGGSIRQPASFCGIVGVKPTYGRCSRYGMVSFASSLDQASVYGRTVSDAAIVLDAIMGFDPKDSTTANLQKPDLTNLMPKVKGRKFGVIKELAALNLRSDIEKHYQQAQQWLVEAGAELVEVSVPSIEHSLSIYYIIAPAEASSNLSRYDGVRYGFRAEAAKNLDELYTQTRTQGFGPEVQRRILIGTFVLSHEYYDLFFRKAQRMRTQIAKEFASVFKQVEALVCPVTPNDAFAIDAKLTPVEMYLNDIYTIPASMAGLPAMSVPVGLSQNNLPLGVQVIAGRFQERTMFEFATAIEQAASWKGLKV